MLEYSWFFSREHPDVVTKYHLWLAFSERPGEEVLDFLESQNILVSWPHGGSKLLAAAAF